LNYNDLVPSLHTLNPTMRLLRCDNNGEISLVNDLVDRDTIPPYAILSHTWGDDDKEVTFADLIRGTGEDKPGYGKIKFCGEQARQAGLEYFWIDTCCINKADQVEHQHAINSMFRWYQNAARCYVFLSDVSTALRTADSEHPHYTWETEFHASRWFTRGWTLQELLAPRSVEFFSKESKRLGDKISLKQQIRKATGIPDAALSGAPLSQFSVNERLSWNERRQTKLEEDRAYCLVGIFGVEISPFYGEGAGGAFRRLMYEIEKLRQCLQDVHLTDPRDDKRRIKEAKGGLLEGSYRWVLDDPYFQQWHDDSQSRLLWITGDPGKGKTMLLCGIIEVLERSTHGLLSYFFCQGTDSRINSATTVLRGLIYLLVIQQPSLVSHLRKKYDQAGRSAFEDVNAWIALSSIFMHITEDPDLRPSYLLVDALDECVIDLPKLLDLIIHTSASSTRIKWLLSSRNEAHIEQKLKVVDPEARLSLELKQNADHVSNAVDVYIDYKLSFLDSLEDVNVRAQVRDLLRRKANGTFLWVALMVQELERPESWDPLQVMNEAPTGLHQLYDHMIDQIQRLTKKNAEICQRLLSTAAIAYRPLYLTELGGLCGLSGQMSVLAGNVRKLVSMCGSFLTIRDEQVYLVHQSAKDYLINGKSDTVFPSQGKMHYALFSQSLKLMHGTLRRDMYGLVAPGFPVDQVKVPVHDPLATIRYSCIHWVDHLCSSLPFKGTRNAERVQDDIAVYNFLKERYLYWLEALSLCNGISKGVVSMAKLEGLVKACVVRAKYLSSSRANSVQRSADAATLTSLIHDAFRFIRYHEGAIKNHPLQVYTSALLFSPADSLTKRLFKQEEPTWITMKPARNNGWNACLQTLEGHSSLVFSVIFSHDLAWLASASCDRTIKIWNASSGECLRTLNGHSGWVNLVAASHDSTWLASASYDHTVKVWDVISGKCLQTLKGHSSQVTSVTFSHSSAWLASASYDNTIKIWDTSGGECLQTLIGHNNALTSVAFSHDSAWLASASYDKTIKIWDTRSGECLKTLDGHSSGVTSVSFSHGSLWLASASYDRTIKIWDANSGECLQTLNGHSSLVTSVAFSQDSVWLASASDDHRVKIWDMSNSKCLYTFKAHSGRVTSVAFSHDSARLASASYDKTVKIWDVSSSDRFQATEGHSDKVTQVAFSHGLTRLVSMSCDGIFRVWDASSGEPLQEFKGHSDEITQVTFSHSLARLASASSDYTIRVWDTSSGEYLQTLEGHHDKVLSVAFSHDSVWLASASDLMVKIWDTNSGECLYTFKGHGRTVSSVAFSYDSAWLASASYDNTIKIWDTSSGECLQTLRHSSGVASVAFSRNCAWLASTSLDGIVSVWDVSSGKCLQTRKLGTTPYHISFANNDHYLYTDIGTFDISALSSSVTPSTSTQFCVPRGLGLSPDNVWITYNSENLVWLPSEYRPSCSAFSGNKIAIGVGTGRVWMCEVALPD
jgi:WD40 repeat protein